MLRSIITQGEDWRQSASAAPIGGEGKEVSYGGEKGQERVDAKKGGEEEHTDVFAG